MSARACVVDYGCGNMHSIVKALEHVGAETTVACDATGLDDADLVVIPGVGAFSEGMRGLRERGQDEAVHRFVRSGRNVLGICLGCQMLLSSSEEFGGGRGLDLIPGEVVVIPPSSERVPHIGWKPLRLTRPADRGLPVPSLRERTMMYFVHSYYCRPSDVSHVRATARHGDHDLPAVIGKGSVFGFQFHPEKSGAVGLEILRDVLRMAVSTAADCALK